jgi:hypothetical protein
MEILIACEDNRKMRSPKLNESGREALATPGVSRVAMDLRAEPWKFAM